MGNIDAFDIDVRNARFPYSIVWTPIPIISWLVPFVGHAGICRGDGVILDFAASNFISVDNFAFGAVARYVIIGNGCGWKEEANGEWEDGLRQSTREYQHMSYNFLTCNCHSFVANCLNRMGMSREWNTVNLAACFLLEGQWVSVRSCFRTVFPTFIVLFICLWLGGWTLFAMWGCIILLFSGWFFLGTYGFKSLIRK